MCSKEQGGRQASLASLTLMHMHTCAGTPRRRFLQAGSPGQRVHTLATCMVLELAGHLQKRPVDSPAGRPSPHWGWGLKGIALFAVANSPTGVGQNSPNSWPPGACKQRYPFTRGVMEVPVLASATPRSPSHLNLGLMASFQKPPPRYFLWGCCIPPKPALPAPGSRGNLTGLL